MSNGTLDLAMLERGRELISLWMGVLRGVRLYDSGNDAIRGAAAKILEHVGALLEGAAELEMRVRHDSIFIAGERIREGAMASTSYHAFIDVLRRSGVTALRISDEATPAEIEDLARLLYETSQGERPRKKLRDELTVRGVVNVGVDFEDGDEELPEDLSQEQVARRVYLRSIAVVKNVFQSMRGDGRINSRMVKRVVQQMIEAVDDGHLLQLTSLKNYDEYTFNHSVNVSVMGIAFGRHVGLDRRQLYVLGQAGMLHDLGKLCVPRSVLNKPGRLTPEERAVIETHPVEGFVSIASRVGVLDETIPVALAAFQHHANQDGTGYPPAALESTTGILSRMVAIVDRYDAMTSARVYRREPISPWKTLAIMYHRQSGQHDAALLSSFMNMLGSFPLGTTVRLSDGTIGIVLGGHPDPELRHLPHVRLILDSDGRPANNQVLDLAAFAKDPEPLTIVETVDPRAFGIEMMDYLL